MSYMIFIGSNFVWKSNEITDSMIEKHVGEFETRKEAELALIKLIEWVSENSDSQIVSDCKI